MIRVAAIVPPASRNLGNDFFSLGGIEAFKQTYKDVETEITYIEFFDSGEIGYGHGRTPLFTKATLDWIRDNADLVVLFAGCALHTNLKHLFDALFSTGVPFLGWGLSPTQYDSSDIAYAKEVADRSDVLAVITRDDVIAQLCGDHKKIISGMDGGWWMGDSYIRPGKSSKYSVVNIEASNQLDPGRCLQVYGELLDKSDDPVYLVSNNCEYGYHFMHPSSLVITNARHLYTTLANADYVITTRAHSTICCLTAGAPLEYIGLRDNRVLGLMNTAGIDLNKDEHKNTQECVEKVAAAKQKFIETIRSRVDISHLAK